jgi:hypothetical protein
MPAAFFLTQVPAKHFAHALYRLQPTCSNLLLCSSTPFLAQPTVVLNAKLS